MSNQSYTDDLIMSTRSRRANAGNKMHKLLEQELTGMEKSLPIDEDEVALLFQEDEEDEEFRIDSKKRDAEEEMFSDSDSESSKNSDTEEGERELEKQERQKRRLIQKKKNQVPVIKRVKKEKKDKIKRLLSEELNPESLLIESRRTSKRSSVVANKLKVYEKLTKAEEKRKQIQMKLKKQKESQDQKLLTQEDRLRIAEETEKLNISSLNKYKEQEISKKQTRLAMQLREKKSFKENEQIIKWISTQWTVSPNTEIEDRIYWEGVLSKKDKRRKKYGRRKKTESGVSEDVESGKKIVDVNCSQQETTETINEEGKAEVVTKQEVQIEEQYDSKSQELKENKNGEANLENVQNIERHDTDFYPDGVENSKQNGNSPKDDIMKDEKSFDVVQGEELLDVEGSTNSGKPEEDSSPWPQSPEMSTEAKAELTTSMKSSNCNDSVSSANEKHISFARRDEVTLMNSEDPPILIQSPKRKSFGAEEQVIDIENNIANEEDSTNVIYVGPHQKVGRNFIMIYRFPDSACNLQNNEFKSALFGPQWAQPENSRAQVVEKVESFKMPDEEKSDYLFVPDTSILDKFPRFGEFDKKLSHKVSIETNTKDKIEINTEAPMGVFLPNGVRKHCLITNKECKYFDPRNGVPYADVTAIKVIQELLEYYGDDGEVLNPNYQWFGFGRGGIYLDVAGRPATGVPEGFK